MSNEGDVPAAAGPESLAWGESPTLYLSYGTVALKGLCPAQPDTVAAMESFTVLTPPMGLDYFAVFDGAAVAERLYARLGGAIAEQVEEELFRESPRFGGASSHNVVGWWRTVIEEAFRAVYEEVASEGEDAPVGETAALVALVLKKYIVIANCGASKAVLCRDGEHVELIPGPERRANKEDENKQSVENTGVHVVDSSSKLDNVLQTNGASGPLASVVIPELDVVAVERKEQDEFLILANDGLWGTVAPESACAFVHRRLGKTSSWITMPCEPPMDAMGSANLLAKKLAEKAVHAGSQDNVVSIAIVCSGTSGFRVLRSE